MKNTNNIIGTGLRRGVPPGPAPTPIWGRNLSPVLA